MLISKHVSKIKIPIIVQELSHNQLEVEVVILGLMQHLKKPLGLTQKELHLNSLWEGKVAQVGLEEMLN